MSVKFIPETHKYVSVREGEDINWISVTTLIGKLKQPFDKKKVASRSSRSKKSKWYGMTPEEIIGKKVTVLANLAPRVIAKVESQGMILMTETPDGKLVFVNPDEAGVGNGNGIN